MDPIAEAHVAEPGLLVIELAAADDATAFAFQDALARMWATATADRTTRDPGQPGVRLRLFTDLRQTLHQPSAQEDTSRTGGRPRGG